MTISTLGPSGWMSDPNQASRLRVDEGQIGFWQGWQFRSYLELNIPVAGPSVSARFVALTDFILWEQSLNLTQGALRMEIFVGEVTPAGVWTAVPTFGVNRMTSKGAPQPLYESSVVIETGGTFTGGTPVDLVLLRAATQNGGAQNVGMSAGERGLPAGSYYVRLSTITGGLVVNDPAQGIYTVQWEERP